MRQFLKNKSFFLFCVLILFSLVFIANNFNFNQLPFILIHLLIGIISIKIVVKKNCGLLTQSAGIFFLVFFSIFPIYELNNGIIYWDGEDFNFETKLLGASLIFIFVLLFWVALSIKISQEKKSSFIDNIFQITIIPTKKNKWLIFSLIIGIIILFKIYEFNFSAFFVKGGEFSGEINFETKSFYLIVEFFMRPLLFNIGLVYILLISKNTIYKIFIFSAMIFVASPSGVSRFLVAALYMPLAITYFSSRIIKNQRQLFHDFYLYPCILLLGLFFAFPLLEIFRNFSPEKFNTFSILEYQTGGSFDAYQMFLRSLDVGLISYGYGFIGAIFFFIPRSIWELKPETSGIEISKLSYLRLENVSMPLIGEFYLNFWYFGIILGSLLIALLFKKIDTYYLKYSFTKLSLGHLIYFQMAGLAIYNMRGGFLSSFAYTISILLSWLVLILILRNNSFNKNSAR